jgi:hypothetical protein
MIIMITIAYLICCFYLLYRANDSFYRGYFQGLEDKEPYVPTASLERSIIQHGDLRRFDNIQDVLDYLDEFDQPRFPMNKKDLH